MKYLVENQENEIVLIDDDEVIRMAWEFAAEIAGEKIITYSSPDEFNAVLLKFDNKTLIYIDSDLGNGIKGEFFAKQLHEKGFINICMSTGYSADRFINMPWIKAVIGKEPPFLNEIYKTLHR